MRIAACQMNSRQDKTANLAVALDLLDQAAKAGVDLAVLPEYFDYLGSDEGALAVAEPIPGPLSDAMAARTRALGLWVLAGSMHARHAADGRRTDASLLFDRAGTCGKVGASGRHGSQLPRLCASKKGQYVRANTGAFL